MGYFHMESAHVCRQCGCPYLICVHPSQVHQWVLVFGVLRDVDDYRCHAYWNTSCCDLRGTEENILVIATSCTCCKNNNHHLCVDVRQPLSGKIESI